MDLLKRELAPIPSEAWTEIDRQAAQALKPELSARAVVDFSGPHGWSLGAVNLGRLEIPPEHKDHDVPWGRRAVQPLVEARVPFTLAQMELDNAARGARDLKLDALRKAAQRIALFEERAVYLGFEPGQVQGILPASRHPAVLLPKNPLEYPRAVGEALKVLRLAGVGGPYALVLSTDLYYALFSTESCYPAQRLIAEMLGGDILQSAALDGGVVLSTRGGDFTLTVGQDLAVGYESHDRQNVTFFLTESLTFQVLEPAAAVGLVSKGREPGK